MSLYIERRKVSCFVQKYLATDRFMKIAAQPKKRVSSMFGYAGQAQCRECQLAAAPEGQAWLRHQGQTNPPSQLDRSKIYRYSYTSTAAISKVARRLQCAKPRCVAHYSSAVQCVCTATAAVSLQYQAACLTPHIFSY